MTVTNAIIAPGMLLAVLGLALGFHDFRRIASGVALALFLMVVTILVAGGRGEPGAVLTGCWLSLIAITALVYWPYGWGAHSATLCIASANAGLWSGMVIASESAVGSLPAVVASLLLVLPTRFCVRRGWTIAPRVLTSWLLAVAILAAALPFLVTHPGYVPDHRM